MSNTVARIALSRLAFALLFFLLLLVLPRVSSADSLNDELNAAATTYYQGRIKTSIESLRQLADREFANGTPESQQTSLEYLLDVCTGALNYACLQKYTPMYDRVVASRPDIPAQLKRGFALHVAYYFGVVAWLSGQKEQALTWMTNVPESAGEELWDVRNYIRRQLLRARLYIVLKKNDDAQLCVDRALMTIASVKNVGSSQLEVSVWLSDAIEILNVLGDSERALGLVQTNASFGPKIFPPNSIEFYWLLQRAAGVFQAVGLLTQARDTAQRASKVLAQLELDPEVSNYLRADSDTGIAMMCLILNDIDCATQELKDHPAASNLAEIRQHGSLEGFVDVSYFAMRAVVNAVQGKQEIQQDLDLMATPVQPLYPMPEILYERLELYRRIAHALSLAKSAPIAGRTEMKSVAPELLRIELEGPFSFGPLRRLDAVQHLMNELVLMSLGQGDLDSTSGDLVVRLIDLDSRNGTSFAVEALALMAATRNEDLREKVRSVLRLTSRRDAAERKDIARILSSHPELDPAKSVTPIALDFAVRTMYSDYGRVRRQLLSQINSSQPDLSSAILPPTLSQLQSILGQNEAIVGAPLFYGGTMGHLCVRRDTIRFTTGPEDMARLIRDVQLVSAALTVENAPSSELDSQYPIGSARDFYNVVLRPTEGCLQGAGSVLWTGQAPREIPLAALLTDGTADTLGRIPLSEWPWFIKSYDVSYVESLATLVALRSRRIPWEDKTSAEFLGVGDPIFSGSTADGEDRGRLALRGAIGIGDLSSLPPLPDTKKEIEKIATLFPQRATVLTEHMATEAELRRQPLGNFDYISFATHGLVRQDIDKLTEPALALTPESSTDSYNDGLLTSSEIADLPLRARFVALSACNTAAIDFTKYASEISALSAAFEVAGVSSVLATLWPVESDASARIVHDTFRNLVVDNSGPAHALAQAQRDYLTHPPSAAHSHPRFWAPFAIFGDSIDPLMERERSPTPRISSVRLLTHTGGEVYSMAKGEANEHIIRAMGDIRKGARHASMTAAVDNNLNILWVQESDEIGASTLLLHNLKDIIAGGYRGGGQGNPVSSSIVYLDEHGRVDKEWALSNPPDDVFPLGILKVNEQSALVAMDRHPEVTSQDAAPAEDRLIIAEARRDQPLTIRADVRLGANDLRSFGSLSWLGGSVLVAVSELFAPIKEDPYFDDFHELRGCLNAPLTKLLLFDSTNWKVLWEKELPAVQLSATVNSSQGSVYFVGAARRSCDEGNRLGLWEVTKAREIKSLYLDQGPVDTTGTGISLRTDGSLVLFGRVERITDVASLEERDTSKMVGRSTSGRVNFSTRQTSDAIVAEINPKGRLISRYTIRAGSDLWVHGAEDVGDEVWMYGALGGEAALMRLQVPTKSAR